MGPSVQTPYKEEPDSLTFSSTNKLKMHTAKFRSTCAPTFPSKHGYWVFWRQTSTSTLPKPLPPMGETSILSPEHCFWREGLVPGWSSLEERVRQIQQRNESFKWVLEQRPFVLRHRRSHVLQGGKVESCWANVTLTSTPRSWDKCTQKHGSVIALLADRTWWSFSCRGKPHPETSPTQNWEDCQWLTPTGPVLLN